MIGDHPNRREPRPQGKLRVLKDRADFDREALPAGIAFVSIRPRQRADLGRVGVAAQRAELPVSPANGRQVIHGRLLGREGPEQLDEGFEILDHGGLSQ